MKHIHSVSLVVIFFTILMGVIDDERHLVGIRK